MRSDLARVRSAVALAGCLGLLSTIVVQAASTCPDEQKERQVPQDIARCRELLPRVKVVHGKPLNEYETDLGEFLGKLCHRSEELGFKVDKRLRDTGPWTGRYLNGKWVGKYAGTHAPVLVWYSKEMFEWLKTHRPDKKSVAQVPVPDGAIMIKEMYPPPAAACQDVPWEYLRPLSQSSAVMVRDSKGSHDGWFWGWYGWEGSTWEVDWPAPPSSPSLRMSFGQYCTNCHASAKDNSTFSDVPGFPTGSRT